MVNLEQTTIAEQLKRIAAYRGYTLKTLGEEFNRRFGKRYVQQSFSKKINAGAIRYDELKQFGDILGFKVELELVDQPPQGTAQ